MKTFLLLIGFGIAMIVGTLSDETNIYTGTKQKKVIEATFDGYEGGYYFFTDKKNRAVSLTLDSQLPAHLDDLKAGIHIGGTFEITVLTNLDEDYALLVNDENLVKFDRKK